MRSSSLGHLVLYVNKNDFGLFPYLSSFSTYYLLLKIRVDIDKRKKNTYRCWIKVWHLWLFKVVKYLNFGRIRRYVIFNTNLCGWVFGSGYHPIRYRQIRSYSVPVSTSNVITYAIVRVHLLRITFCMKNFLLDEKPVSTRFWRITSFFCYHMSRSC